MNGESLESSAESAPVVRSGWLASLRDYHLLVPNMTVRMANTMSTAVLPLLLVSLAFPSTSVGYIVSFGGFTSMIMNFAGGALSDYFSKRKLMLAGIVGVSASTSLLGFASTASQFIAIRLAQGFATGIFRPTSQALAYEINPARRAYILGLLGSSYVLGNAVGPALGGIMADELGLRATMYLAGALAGGAALYVAAVYRKLPNPARSQQPLRLQLASVFRDNPLQTSVPLVVVMSDAWILNTWQVYLPIYLKKYLNASYTQIGLCIGVESAVYVLAQPYAGRLIDRVGVRIPLSLSMLGHGALIACMPLLDSSIWILLCLTLVGISNSAANPASVLLTAQLSRAEHRGLSLGLLSSASNFGQFVGPIVAGVVIAAFDSEACAFVACIIPGIIGALAPLLLRASSASSQEAK